VIRNKRKSDFIRVNNLNEVKNKYPVFTGSGKLNEKFVATYFFSKIK